MGKRINRSAALVVASYTAIFAMFAVQSIKMPLALFGVLVGIFLICLLIGIFILIPSLYKKYVNSLKILENLRCTYWTKEKQLAVTFWYRDESDAEFLSIECVVQIGEQVVEVNDKVLIGGTYMDTNKNVLKSGRIQPIMVECSQKNVDLSDVNKAVIRVTMKPLGGVWLTKKRSKEVEVQVVNH